MTRSVNVPARLMVSFVASAILAVAGLGLQLCWWRDWSVPVPVLLGLLFLFVALQVSARWVREPVRCRRGGPPCLTPRLFGYGWPFLPDQSLL